MTNNKKEDLKATVNIDCCFFWGDKFIKVILEKYSKI